MKTCTKTHLNSLFFPFDFKIAQTHVEFITLIDLDEFQLAYIGENADSLQYYFLFSKTATILDVLNVNMLKYF